ncbi:MAG: hypothetical protein JOZ39_03955, partial [Chloroflexi bacterium]|nr:hypothetical protein [Chloroflexota bacterium]
MRTRRQARRRAVPRACATSIAGVDPHYTVGPSPAASGRNRAGGACVYRTDTFFYITNDWVSEPDEIVFAANDRCNQENLLAQLHSGCRALTAPCDNLLSNWAYMVMTALAWDLKAWWALWLPEGRGGHREAYRADKQWVLRLEFKRFVQAFVRLPCQIVRTGRRL